MNARGSGSDPPHGGDEARDERTVISPETREHPEIAVEAAPPISEIPQRTLAKAAVVAFVGVMLLLFWYVRDVLLLGFAGILVAILLRGAAIKLRDYTGMPRRLAVILTLAAAIGSLVGTFWWQGPTLGEQFTELQQELPRAIEQLRERVERHELGRRVIEEIPEPTEVLAGSQTTVARATGIVSRTFSAIANFLLVVFIGVVLAFQPRPYLRGLVRLVPVPHRPRTWEILADLEHMMRRWLVAQLIAMVVVGVLTYIGLVMLGIPLAFTLALIAAVFEFIPYIGPILSGAPAVLLTLVVAPEKVLWVLGLYVAIQSFESYVMSPILNWKAVWLPPALVIIAQLTLASLMGLFGVALAAPLTAVVMTLTKRLYVDEVLDDPDADDEDEEMSWRRFGRRWMDRASRDRRER